MEEILDFSQLPRTLSKGLEGCSHGVLMLKPMSYFFNDTLVASDPNRAIFSLRSLRTKYDELRESVEVEGGVCLSTIPEPVEADAVAA